MKTLLLATHNAGKIKELTALLSPIKCISQGELGIGSVEETCLTFVENALLKARYASSIANLPALADDSGLVVPALSGKPGIHSARFASPHATNAENIEALLAATAHLDEAKRHAYFYCVLALLQHPNDPAPVIATGIWHGRIQHKLQGAQGFGYDPIFYLDTHACTAAELSTAVKNQISHRAKAFQHLKSQLLTYE